ncbi:MAG TPA: hypothetical protein VGR35_03795 [Tepidisphaeraceae bacterium]|nr:hypothetical protein [Tepidisphaeraceae bacterium]
MLANVGQNELAIKQFLRVSVQQIHVKITNGLLKVNLLQFRRPLAQRLHETLIRAFCVAQLTQPNQQSSPPLSHSEGVNHLPIVIRRQRTVVVRPIEIALGLPANHWVVMRQERNDLLGRQHHSGPFSCVLPHKLLCRPCIFNNALSFTATPCDCRPLHIRLDAQTESGPPRADLTRDPTRVKFDPRWRPDRWIRRDAEPHQFWLDVAWHTLIAAAAIAMAVSWLRK